MSGPCPIPFWQQQLLVASTSTKVKSCSLFGDMNFSVSVCYRSGERTVNPADVLSASNRRSSLRSALPFFGGGGVRGGGGGVGSILFLKTYVLSVWSCLYYLKSVAVPLLLYHVSVHFLPLCFCNDPHLFANCFQMCLVLSLTPRPFCQYSSHSFC